MILSDEISGSFGGENVIGAQCRNNGFRIAHALKADRKELADMRSAVNSLVNKVAIYRMHRKIAHFPLLIHCSDVDYPVTTPVFMRVSGPNLSNILNIPCLFHCYSAFREIGTRASRLCGLRATFNLSYHNPKIVDELGHFGMAGLVIGSTQN